MTVGYGIGLGIGNTNAVAVLQSSDAPLGDPPTFSEPATLRITPASAVLGAPPAEPGVLSGFVDSVGAPDGITAADGTSYLAEDLVATATASLAATAAQQFPGFATGPARVTVHPARWSDEQVGALRSALDRAGLWAVRLVPDAVAAAAWFRAAHGADRDAVVAVCDFAAAGLTVSLVRSADEPYLMPPSTFSPLFGGDDLDAALADHVLAAASTDLGGVDLTDPATHADVAVLRERCRSAKEQLSSADEVTVPVTIGSASTEVTVTRTEFEGIARGPLQGALGLVGETLRAHDVDAGSLRAVVLTGGGAAIPLLSELSAALPAEGVIAPHPGRVAVHGAAILGAGPMAATGGLAAAAGAAAVSAADVPTAGVAAVGDISGDADTDELPVVTPQALHTAFTEAGAGNPVQPMSAEIPAVVPAAAPTRNRRVLVAGAVLAALVIAGGIGAFALTGGDDDTAGTPVPGVTSTTAPSTTTTARPTTTTTTTTTTEEAPVTTVVVPPPVTTTVVAPPPVVTTTPPVATTTVTTATTTTTTRDRDRDKEEEEEETTTTTTTTTESETTTPTTPDSGDEDEDGTEGNPGE